MSTWLLIDVSNLAYRNFFALGDLSHGGEPTAAVYGVFRDIEMLRDRYSTRHVAFCFDGGSYQRVKIFPGYKRSRLASDIGMPEEEKDARRALRNQIYNLRVRYLPDAGFNNILYQEGYEADDVIASVCLNSNPDKKRSFVVVSSDNDMFQLLSPTVSMWSPALKRPLSEAWFRNSYGISPGQWADVKALAGCSSDDIPGIKSIGDKRASQFLAGTLNPKSKAYEAIVECTEVWDRNIKLTRLPIPGTRTFDLVFDDVDSKNWNSVVVSLGMKSLIRTPGVAGKVVQRRRL